MPDGVPRLHSAKPASLPPNTPCLAYCLLVSPQHQKFESATRNLAKCMPKKHRFSPRRAQQGLPGSSPSFSANQTLPGLDLCYAVHRSLRHAAARCLTLYGLASLTGSDLLDIRASGLVDTLLGFGNVCCMVEPLCQMPAGRVLHDRCDNDTNFSERILVLPFSSCFICTALLRLTPHGHPLLSAFKSSCHP